ncbi:SpoIIAA-like [Fodinibius salinus]|uniref:SpoIIAA-like n=1 Tax=Fodinibius salinus TaxID=860790 RepID=A0A5D3YPJ1_9BACT|nr:STAS/SEC14 domain-containing protein [Fodinibius salinus]TYP94953.1 SpoIIAA-like [Fodinibius salinus]
MIEVNDHTDDDILAIKASGKLSKEDLDHLEPALNKFTTASDDPHLIMILEDFEGWQDTAALWKDLQLDVEYIGYFDRIAVVGEKKWQKWGTKLVDPITKEEMQFFSIDQAGNAREWLKQNHN